MRECRGCIAVALEGVSPGVCIVEKPAMASVFAENISMPLLNIAAHAKVGDVLTAGHEVGDISASARKYETTINTGLVCGRDIGLPVLYASDGVLITIDGKYLIVRK